jgi:hypothetical protein
MNVQRTAAVSVCLCVAWGAARISAQGAAPAFAATDAVQAPAPAPAGTGPRSTARLTGLSVVLVTGDSEDGSASGRPSGTPLEIPAAARKALASISSFLPYKSYSMADAALVSTTANSSSTVTMRDPDISNTLLRLQLSPRGPFADSWNISVMLSEINVAARPEDNTRSLISTSIAVVPGETVVVGTSRIGGGRKAYVLLLTAIGSK